MKILRVAQRLYPDVKGGGAYHAHAMSRDQAAMGHDVTVLTVGDETGQETRDGYTVKRYASLCSPLGNEVAPGLFRQLQSVPSYDVVHAHSHLYLSTNLAALARLRYDTPLAITNHGLYSQNAPKRVFDVYLRTLGRATFDAADVVFTYTDEERRRLESLGVGSDIAMVSNGIDTSRFTPDGARSDLVDHDGRTLLFVGRLVDGKRPQDAVRLLERLDGSHDAHLYIAGEGPMRPRLEKLADDLGIAETVTFLGQVPYDEMPRLYRCADVLVLSSRAEGVPRTVLEALASGVPVVASDLEQVTPIVETAGRTVPVGDVEGFTRAVDAVLRDRETVAAGARQLVLDSFQWQETVDRTTDRLSTLLR